MCVCIYVHVCTFTFLCKYKKLGTLEGSQQVRIKSNTVTTVVLV